MMGRVMRWSLLLFVLIALLGLTTVRADDPVNEPAADAAADEEDLEVEDEDEEEEFEEYEEEEDILYYDFMPHPDIEAKFVFPDAVDNKLPLGEQATLLVVLTNVGGDVFTMREVKAHLHSRYDYTYYIQNYTGMYPNTPLGPDMEVTLKYVFTPHKSLEPLDFWFSADVSYNNSEVDKIFRTTIVNGTIGLYESDTTFTYADASIYMLLVGLVGLVGLSVVNKFKKPSYARATTNTDTAVASGWGASAQKAESRPVRRRRSSSKGKRNKKQD